MKKITIDKTYIVWKSRISNSWCWEWIWCKNKDGYGKIKNSWNNLYSHRVSFELFNWVIPPWFLVCHTCDNPKCVNPKHLFIWTNEDNMKDMAHKGRATKRKETFYQKGNTARAKRISIEWIEFSSYTEAGKFHWISDNGVRKRFKWKIVEL